MDVRQLPLLVGLELDELSGSAAAIPAIKAGISRLCTTDCRRLLEQAMACGEAEEVDRLMEAQLPLLDAGLVLLSSDSASKEEAIREIVDAFYLGGRTGAPHKVEEAVWAREAVYSTGLGYGFAIPHCKTDAVNANSIGILRLKEPVEWGSMDGKPVSLVILLAMRESDTNGSHMKVFARLARKLMHEEFRKALLAAPDPGAMIAALSEVTSDPA
jgi:fructose-specific PTS system IIA-like component